MGVTLVLKGRFFCIVLLFEDGLKMKESGKWAREKPLSLSLSLYLLQGGGALFSYFSSIAKTAHPAWSLYRAGRVIAIRFSDQRTPEHLRSFYLGVFLYLLDRLLLYLERRSGADAWMNLDSLLQKIPIFHPLTAHGWSGRSLWSYSLSSCVNFNPQLWLQTWLSHMKIPPFKDNRFGCRKPLSPLIITSF
jgi:hypothetical protein